MVECYINAVEEYLMKVVSPYQRDLDERLHLFLLACRASTCETTGTVLASMVLGRGLCLRYYLLFWGCAKQGETSD
jgi:hypothetical protein